MIAFHSSNPELATARTAWPGETIALGPDFALPAVKVVALVNEDGLIMSLYMGGSDYRSEPGRALKWRRRLQRLPTALRLGWILFWNNWR